MVVGAPFYTDDKGNGGAAYIYINNKGFHQNHEFIRLVGPKESRFGSALSSVGDLNRDGYDDLAVGAPYAQDGHGAVYIFLGAREGIVKEPSQVINYT